MKYILLHEKRKLILYTFVFIAIYLFVIFLNKFPVYYAAKNTPFGYFYSGQASWFDPWDINVYVSAILNGQNHGILLPNLYTTQSDSSVFIYSLYTTVGYTFKHADPFLLFHYLGISTTFILCLGLFFSAYLITQKVKLSLLVTFIAIQGRGLGWITILNKTSADINVAGFTFRSTVQRPHEAIGILLYILALSSFFRFTQTNQTRYTFLSFACLLTLVIFYPYYLLIFFLTYVLFFLIYSTNKRVLFLLYLQTIGAGLLSVLYYLYLRDTSFLSAISEVQAKIPPFAVLTGYGPFVPVYMYSFSKLSIGKKIRIFLFIWFTLGLVCSYMPFGFARFFFRGLFFPLVVLTLIEFDPFFNLKKRINIKALILIGITLSSILTSMFVFTKRIAETNNDNPFYYLPLEYKSAFRYLSLTPKDGVISNPLTGNFIPAYTGKHVYAGHLLQTPQIEERGTKIKNVFSQKNNPSEAKDFLRKNNISYVFFGDYEKKAGYSDPEYLELLFFNRKVKIYAVD